MKRLLLLLAVLGLVSCGREQTRKKLLDKVWRVVDVTPPANGTFDVEATNEAEDLKNGFYRHATFEFRSGGLFRTRFSGKPDSGNYQISFDGTILSLYPLHGTKMYEQIRILRLTKHEFDFNTVLSRFYMTLHLKNP